MVQNQSVKGPLKILSAIKPLCSLQRAFCAVVPHVKGSFQNHKPCQRTTLFLRVNLLTNQNRECESRFFCKNFLLACLSTSITLIQNAKLSSPPSHPICLICSTIPSFIYKPPNVAPCHVSRLRVMDFLVFGQRDQTRLQSLKSLIAIRLHISEVELDTAIGSHVCNRVSILESLFLIA